MLYDGESSSGKKALAYAYTLAPNVKLNRQDVCKVKLSTTFLRQVIQKLQLRPKDLMNRADPFYQEHVRGRDLDDEGWLNVLANNPQLLRAPIALMGQHAVICDPASLIYTLTQTSTATKAETA